MLSKLKSLRRGSPPVGTGPPAEVEATPEGGNAHSPTSPALAAQQPGPHAPPSPGQESQEVKAAVLPQKVPPASPKSRRSAMETPTVKLTVNLLATYKGINKVSTSRGLTGNQVYRENQRQKDDGKVIRPCDSCTIRIGDLLDGRYRVEKLLGKGTFANVLRCVDESKNKQTVAVKIVRREKVCTELAMRERDLLQSMNSSDPTNEMCIVKLLREFMLNGHHFCMVFEELSVNLYELLRNTSFRGVSLKLDRRFTTQILTAMRYWLPISHGGLGGVRGSNAMIHCDLKPENVLLVNPHRSMIKVIDFGSAVFEDGKTRTYVQSRFYRAPEIMIGLPTTTAADIWSLGCIIVEMHTGEPLFSGSNEHEMLYRFEALMGYIPQHILQKGKRSQVLKFYDLVKDGAAGSDDPEERFVMKPLPNPPRKITKRAAGDFFWRARVQAHGRGEVEVRMCPQTQAGHTSTDYFTLEVLLTKMLALDPKHRPRPIDILNDPWFTTHKAEMVQSDVTFPAKLPLPEGYGPFRDPEQQDELGEDDMRPPSPRTPKKSAVGPLKLGFLQTGDSVAELSGLDGAALLSPARGAGSALPTAPPGEASGRSAPRENVERSGAMAPLRQLSSLSVAPDPLVKRGSRGSMAEESGWDFPKILSPSSGMSVGVQVSLIPREKL